MKRGLKTTILVLFLCLLVLASTYFWAEKSYMLVGILMIALVLVPFIARFEKRRVRAEELVLLAVLIAIAAVARVPFAALPSIQPTSFVVILSAMVFGAEAGFLIGGMSAFISNLFLGQGPWTPWQMFAWGVMGWTAGLLKDTVVMKNQYLRMLFGFVWGFLFGWMMNFWYLLNLGEAITWKAVLFGAVTSAPMDLNHAVCNVVFLSIFSSPWLKTLQRTKDKFGVL